MKRPISERIKGGVVVNGDCWEWQGCKNRKGYGCIQINKKSILAHRASYEEFIGRINDGNYVLHRCDNPCCVNPAHLFQGSQADNMQDMLRKGRGRKPRGDDHPSAKLNAEQALEIFKDDGNQRELAKRFGISKGLVWAIKKGKAWGHLTGATALQVRFAREALRASTA